MPQNGDVRLVNVNDSTNMTGRLEVYYNGQWGTVCDDYFDTNAAAVVCRQLGFNPDGALVVVRAGYGQGTGNISLDDIFCFRSEQTINSCNHNGWGTHNCNHSEDVGIICLCKFRILSYIHAYSYTVAIIGIIFSNFNLLVSATYSKICNITNSYVIIQNSYGISIYRNTSWIQICF